VARLIDARSDPGFTRSRGGRRDRRLEVAESTPIGVESSIVDSMGHVIFRKTYSYDVRPISTTATDNLAGQVKRPSRSPNRVATLLLALSLVASRSRLRSLSLSPASALVRYVTTRATWWSSADRPLTTVAAIEHQHWRARLDKNASGRQLRSAPVPVRAQDDPVHAHAETRSSHNP
jgi:hypothetical protein